MAVQSKNNNNKIKIKIKNSGKDCYVSVLLHIILCCSKLQVWFLRTLFGSRTTLLLVVLYEVCIHIIISSTS